MFQTPLVGFLKQTRTKRRVNLDRRADNPGGQGIFFQPSPNFTLNFRPKSADCFAENQIPAKKKL